MKATLLLIWSAVCAIHMTSCETARVETRKNPRINPIVDASCNYYGFLGGNQVKAIAKMSKNVAENTYSGRLTIIKVENITQVLYVDHPGTPDSTGPMNIVTTSHGAVVGKVTPSVEVLIHQPGYYDGTIKFTDGTELPLKLKRGGGHTYLNGGREEELVDETIRKQMQN